MAEWKFRQMRLSEQNRDPVDKEFFRRERAVASLVREVIQNSLDAATAPGSEPVRVRLFISGQAAALSESSARKWVSGLGEHLRAADPDLAPTRLNGPMPFVAIEDFGTRGLCGNPRAARQSELGDGSKEDFFYFWRNVGRSGKKEDQRGSWGLGKAVYADTSTIGAMFGWTIRSTDAKSLLMGQAVAKIHELPGPGGRTVQHDAYGFYGEFGGRQEDPEFALPVEGGDVVARFRDEFGLSRRDEPGLSIVIPLPKGTLGNEDHADQYALEVIQQYAYPILRRELVVEVVTPTKSFLLNHDGLLETLEKVTWAGSGYDKDATERFLLLVLEVLESPQLVELLRDAGPRGVSASWDMLKLPEDAISECRERFNRKELVAFKVPVLVRHRRRDDALSHFTVFLKQDDEVKATAFQFIRQGLTLPEVPAPPGVGIVGFVCVEDAPLARLLRDAENPSHTKWLDRSDRLKQEYTGGPERVRVVEWAPRVLLKWMMDTDSKRDTELFAEFFPEPDIDAAHPGATSGRGRGPRPPVPPPPIPPSRPKPIRINRIAGGFAIVRLPEVAAPSRTLVVEAAFDCVGGNPFSQWEPFDFDVGKAPIVATVKAGTGTIEQKAGRRLRCRVERDDFELDVRGFLESRDLVVKTRWIPDEEVA